MPRTLKNGLNVILAGSAESHTTLELSLPSDIAPAQTLYLATTRLVIDGVTYDNQLKEASSVKASLTRAADRASVDIQNADAVFGVDALRLADTLYGAKAKLGRYWRDLQSKASFQHTLLTGVVASVDINETVVRLGLVTDIYSPVNVGASEQVIRKCRWQVSGRFRGAECGYSGPLLTCNGLLDSADGCQGRHGSTDKRARFGGFAYLESAATIAGAASLPVPAYNQLVKLASNTGTVSSTGKQQPFLALNEDGFNLTNDDTNLQSRISPKYSVQAINAVFDHQAIADGVTDTTTEVAAAIAAANSAGRPLYFPTGTYLINQAVFTDLNSLHIFGDGPNRSILKSNDNTKAVLEINAAASASHTITIENLSVEGAGTGSNNHGIYIHGAAGLFNFTIRNVFVRDCGGNGVKITDSAFTQLLEAVDVSGCGNHAIDLVSGNTTTLDRCYVHAVATNKAAYRIRYGDVVMRGCNGIDSGTTADWGVFGQDTATDGTDTYARVILHGCNVEDFTNRGIYCKAGSFASFFATPILAPASGTVKAIKLDFVSTDSCGIFDAASSINTKGASWSNSEPVHSSGMPFVQIGHRDLSTYYDTNVGASTSLPGVTGTLIAGSTDYALTFDGWTRFKNPSRIDEVSAPSTPPANSIFLYAKDKSGVSTLYYKKDDGTEVELGAGITGSLTSGQVPYATGSNTVATSPNFAWDNGAKALTVSSAGVNAAVYVADTANTITARFGTLAAAPDRAIIGTTTNHPVVLYQNNAEAWGVDASKHFRPYNGATAQDLGVASVPIRDVHVGGNAVFYERTAPSTPGANSLVLYAKDKAGVSTLYYKNDAGTETELGGAGGGGSVTTVSVASANGFAGSVANATTTPAITISTTITGLLKGNGTAISAASAGTDYVTPTGAETLTNKTISGATNTITNLSTSSITSGTLAVANGGTGQTSYTNGQLLIGNTTGNTLTKATLTGTSGQIDVTNGAGSITLAASVELQAAEALFLLRNCI